jgi:hypothetical protein
MTDRLKTAVLNSPSHAIHAIELKFTIDIRTDLWYSPVCYLEQASLTHPFAIPLTLDLSSACRLLFTLSREGQSLAPLFPTAVLCFQ